MHPFPIIGKITLTPHKQDPEYCFLLEKWNKSKITETNFNILYILGPPYHNVHTGHVYFATWTFIHNRCGSINNVTQMKTHKSPHIPHYEQTTLAKTGWTNSMLTLWIFITPSCSCKYKSLTFTLILRKSSNRT